MPSSNPADRSGIWSYVPFGSSPRRRSVSSGLPLRHSANGSADNTPWDPFEKSDRQTRGNGAGRTFNLESLQNAWMTQSRQARFYKTGGVLTLIVLLYWFLSGGSSYGSGTNNIYTPGNSPTSRCTKPHDLSKPLVQYAIMIDAGSTGSRIHVYKFNNCGPTPELENEEFKMTEKRPEGSGLSSYKTDAEGAAKSLDPLMQVALTSVPDEYKSCTPVAVKATAGLRLLGDEMSQKILEAVRTRLETKYPFPVVSKENGGVEIMKGEDEGVYAWITTNYLLGKIGGPDETPTAAVFDLGGGSTQIVFQPTFKNSPHGGMPLKMADGDHKYSLKFGGREFELYQHSHLGYGLMSARKALHASVLDRMHKQNPNSREWLSKPIPNSCITPGTQKKVDVTMPADHPLAGEHS
ncbi:Guanosine-diphosphatase, partial [Exophiala xenobiotica]